MVRVHARLRALSEALIVTFLWSSSYVLIKLGLREIPPLTFAAVRYSIAFTVLLIAHLMKGCSETTGRLDRQTWLQLIGAGVVGYAGAQGLQFLGLYYLPAVTTTFLLNFTPCFVLLLGVPVLRETPTRPQVLGLLLALLGAYVYFPTPPPNQVFGVAVVLVSGLAWAFYMIIIRGLQRGNGMKSLKLTVVTMGVGALSLIASALTLEATPCIGLSGWVTIAWLSLFNTAIAFFLWNLALKHMRAFELSMVQNTMLVQIAFLAYLFLDERLETHMVLGMALVLSGVFLVQIYGRQELRARVK